MQSGTTGINTLRIYNPVKQGHDQDPQGRFIRAWVPELRDLPVQHLHTPWTAPDGAKLRYPAPIVDLDMAGRHARDVLWKLRKAEGFRDIAAQVAQKHASRARDSDRSAARAQRHARRKRQNPAQLSLDL